MEDAGDMVFHGKGALECEWRIEWHAEGQPGAVMDKEFHGTMDEAIAEAEAGRDRLVRADSYSLFVIKTQFVRRASLVKPQ